MLLKRIWLICLFLVSIPPAHAAVICVKADSTGTSGTSWGDACPSLQTALSIAKPGDEIWVAKGTYKPTAGMDRYARFMLNPNVPVCGGFAGTETSHDQRDWVAHETILSGEIGTSSTADNSYLIVNGGILDGFTVRGGCAGMSNAGTAVNCKFVKNTNTALSYSAAKNCTFYNNCGYAGGAVQCGTVTDCIFTSNTSTTIGGAIFSGVATNCTFENNYAAESGGAINNNVEDETVVNCRFVNNRSNSDGGGIVGGTATNCVFVNNKAGNSGGGTHATDVNDCVFVGNTSRIGGGAIWGTIRYCVFVSNSADIGGGAACASLYNCTLVNNRGSQGGGYYNESNVFYLTNCILWANDATTGSQSNFKSFSPQFSHCAIQDCGGSGSGWDPSLGTDSGGNIFDDPQFVDIMKPEGPDGIWITPDDGLCLKNSSPCINSGIINYSMHDILGNPVVSRMPDIGAYENQVLVPMPVVAVFEDSTMLTNSSSEVDIGTTMIGSPVLTKTLIIKNLGTVDLYTSATRTSAPFSITRYPSMKVAPGSSTTLEISMTTKATGTFYESLYFNSNDPEQTQFRTTVFGKITIPKVAVINENKVAIGCGDSVRLRSTLTNLSEPNIVLALKNTGDAELHVEKPVIDLPFRIIKAPVSYLSPGDSAEMIISLETRSVGSFNKLLSFATNDPYTPMFTISIYGIIQAEPKILYVNADSKSTTITHNFGGAWATAYPSLQTAIAAAKPGNEIWVAAGTYKPTTQLDRTTSFVMPEDVGIYGGFAGYETSRDQRKVVMNKTILSGELGMSHTTYGELSWDYVNSNHVLRGGNLGTLDGFTITGGHANKGGDMIGAGMVNDFVSPTVSNCRFIKNSAGFSFEYQPGWGHGGAIYNKSASPLICNCVFEDNSTTGGGAYSTGSNGEGGAIYNDASSSPSILSCVFVRNSAKGGYGASYGNFSAKGGDGLGGAIYDAGSASIANCTFISNKVAGGDAQGRSDPRTGQTSGGSPGYALGGAVYVPSGSSSLINCIFWNNRVDKSGGTITYRNCDLQGCGGSGEGWVSALGDDGGGNIASDPKFVNINVPAGPDGIWATGDDGLRLRAGSACIDGGTNMGASEADILGQIHFNRADIGAYENRSRNSAGNWALYR